MTAPAPAPAHDDVAGWVVVIAVILICILAAFLGWKT